MGPAQTETRLFILWVVANSVGWLVGIIIVLMLATLPGSTRVGNVFYVGIGMGWSVGLAQWLIARKWFSATSRWMWASTIGITTPFLVADLVGIQNLSLSVLAALAAIGGLHSGLMQRNCLRPLSPKADWWLLFSAVAWLCPVLLFELVAVPGHPNGAMEAIRNAGSLAFGGVVLGAISGIALRSLLNPKERPVLQ